MTTFYEFFAGGGMVRAGLGSRWTCLFANDRDEKKAATYRDNWGSRGELLVGDIEAVVTPQLPGKPDLLWGSFPCQDLSLAGAGAGLKGKRSGTFYPLWDLVTALGEEGRGPRIVALENVCGALTSHEGRDFDAICGTFARAGYRFGALVIDAALFVPQSRPRLFLVGVRADIAIPPSLVSPTPAGPFHPTALTRAVGRLSDQDRSRVVWWRLPSPPLRAQVFADLVEDNPSGVAWHTKAETGRLLAMMAPGHKAKVSAAMASGGRMVGAVYKRTRRDDQGRKVQRAEVRFDDLAGCLRTPGGGSSRQTIVVVDGDQVRSRLISARETARLMGLGEDYKLPPVYNEAYHLTGDGVAVPVVRHLAKHLFEPLLEQPPSLQASGRYHADHARDPFEPLRA